MSPKKVKFQNSRGLTIVGLFYSCNSKDVVIMSHGFTGDKSEWGRFDSTAKALQSSGFNVLVFDFSGCGESDDDSLTVDKQIDDLNCAIKFIKEKGFERLLLMGYSLGGLISLRSYSPDIASMVLWAPVTANTREPRSDYSASQLHELDSKGYITKIRTKGIRKKIIIDGRMLDDEGNVNQQQLLSKVKCPVLIIHGDRDESVPLKTAKDAIKLLPEGSKLIVVKGADHEFYDHLSQFVDPSITWLEGYKI